MKKFFTILLLLACITTKAQTVQLVVPYTAGGINDRVARVLEKTLSKRLPYNFVVEYQTGAGGIIAANNVSKNHSKDTVLLIHSSAIATNTFNPNSTYDLFRDFIPVAKLGSVPMVLVANQQSTVTSIKQLKRINSEVLYGSAGTGTASHVAGELLRYNIKRDLSPVFYKGESAAFHDILSNNIPMMFISASTVASFSTSPNISILAITGAKRNFRLPSVPTFSEQGIQGFDRSPNWLVVLANPGADSGILTQIKTALGESLVDTQDIELYNRAGVDIAHQPLSQVTEFLADEIERVQKLHSRLQIQNEQTRK